MAEYGLVRSQNGKIIIGGYELKSSLMNNFFKQYGDEYFKQELAESIRDGLGENILKEVDQDLYKAEGSSVTDAIKFYNAAFSKIDTCEHIDQKLKDKLEKWIRAEIIQAHFML